MHLALFDFDGTITTREMFPDFIHFAVPKWRLAIGKLLLAPVVMGYKTGLLSGSITRASVVQMAFRGVAHAALQQLGKRFANEVLPAALRADQMQRIAWHQQQGDRVIVVSGGFDLYLNHWCQQHTVELLCSSLQVRNGKLTGRYQGAQCVGVEKVRRIQQLCRIEDYPVVYAYGDTKEDLPMLELASQRFYQGKWLV